MAKSSIGAESFLPLSPPETSSCLSHSESRSNAKHNGLERSRLSYAPRLPARATTWQTPPSPALGMTIYTYRGHSGSGKRSDGRREAATHNFQFGSGEALLALFVYPSRWWAYRFIFLTWIDL